MESLGSAGHGGYRSVDLVAMERFDPGDLGFGDFSVPRFGRGGGNWHPEPWGTCGLCRSVIVGCLGGMEASGGRWPKRLEEGEEGSGGGPGQWEWEWE